MASKGKSQHEMARLFQNSFFPCASGVTMPQLGAEDGQMRKHLRMPPADHLELKAGSEDNTPVEQGYLKKISADLRFTEDVVKERCFFAMPYDPKYLKEALDINTLIKRRRKLGDAGRHNAIGADLRHTLCGLKITKPPKPLKPLKKKFALRAQEMTVEAEETPESLQDKESMVKDETNDLASKKEEPGTVSQTPGTFLTEVSSTVLSLQEKLKTLKEAAAAEAEAAKHPKSARLWREGERAKKDWDTYLLSKLSKATATWIVYERTTPSTLQYDDLKKTLYNWYGKPYQTDLVTDVKSDDDDKVDPFDKKQIKIKPKKKWIKDEETLLERVYQMPAMKAKALDPYSDDNEAPFYRQPAGIRKKKKNDLKDESAINATAHAIKVKTLKPPRPPTLRDRIAPGVGKTLYDTKNQYEQELLTGVEQLHPSSGDGFLVKMASNHTYKKKLRPDYPDAPQKWYPPTEKEKEAKEKHSPIRQETGARRWEGLPEVYDDTFEAQKVVPPGYTSQFDGTRDLSAKRQTQQNSTLLQILQEWHSKWNLTSQYADASIEDIIRDMADIQPHVRLKAIATVGKAAEYNPPSDPGIQLGSTIPLVDPIAKIPEHVFVALDCLLGDTNNQVQRAAAITLFALDHPTEKAKQVLRKSLSAEASVERWAAAQCLAHFGVCDSRVVDEIIKQILNSEEPIKHEQGIALLAKISSNTTLVHGMVAEQLNSSSWRHRVIACKILSALSGTVNKDVTQKLTEMMWHDWHTEVRHAAAQCLGKTSHGRDVHDDLKRCIVYGSEKIKLEAISRLGQLGIMTAKLLPAFLECFNDQYVSIRSECCITCGNLQIKEESVIKKLLYLATYDPVWKVKALAIQALGKIGVQSDAMKDCLLWAMRYEEKAGVRAEACHSLKKMLIIDDDVVQITRERLLVESSQVVRDEMVAMLQVAGLNATEDMDMVTQIKGEVRKLCTRNIIASQIVLNEADEMRKQNLCNMIYMSQEELKAREEEHESSRKQLTDYLKSQDREFSATSREPVSREATFTPSADQELEAMMNHEEEAPSREASFLSQPFTSEADSASQACSSPETTERTSLRSAPEQSVDSDDWHHGSTMTVDGGTIEALTPGKSRLGIAPSASLLDLKERWGPAAENVLPGLPAMASREIVKEHDKIKEHMTRAYEELEARYSEMEEELNKIDHGLDVGIPGLKGSKFLELPQHPAAKVLAAQADSLVHSSQSPRTDRSQLDNSLDVDSNTNCQHAGQDTGQVAVSLPVLSEGSQLSTGPHPTSTQPEAAAD